MIWYLDKDTDCSFGFFVVPEIPRDFSRRIEVGNLTVIYLVKLNRAYGCCQIIVGRDGTFPEEEICDIDVIEPRGHLEFDDIPENTNELIAVNFDKKYVIGVVFGKHETKEL